jgi:hypothetical protein
MLKHVWLVLLGVVVMTGCPGGSAGNGTGGPDGGTGGPDGGGGGGGVVDLGCNNDAACAAGQICDLASAACVPGFDCTANNSICAFCGSSDVDCGFGEASSYCDANAGVCRRNKTQCATCTSDNECAESGAGLPSFCRDGFCATGCGACAPGYTCEQGGCVMREALGTCATTPTCEENADCATGLTCSLGRCLALCDSDAACAAGQVCNLMPGPAQQTCVNGCPLGQRATKDGVAVVCHADGRFGPACPGVAGTPEGCPAGLDCRGDGVCELPGCQSDNECTTARTYCDTASSQCVEGCNSVDDCGAFEECIDNACRPQGCRSKDTSCNAGQFCCGAELYEDTSTCPATTSAGLCFLAEDPFCRTCESNDDCADVTAFGFGSQCFELQRQNQQGETETVGKFCSVGCRNDLDCPRDIRCVRDLQDEAGATISGCLDEECALFPAVR